jgi:Ni/Fe-hydrogenase subunit HybB-like protein
MWNHHSVMFEITWCVILYTTVLSLEFAPIVLERLRWHAPIKWIHSVSLPFMILGVLLSTLHQSSFGSLYLIVPNRLHPLWYSPLLPILFYISCIASGISMVILETLILSRNGRTLLPAGLRARLAKIVAVALAVYLVVRFQDMAVRGALHGLGRLTYHSAAFYAEILVGFVAPLVLLLSPRVRASRRGLYAACLMVLAGFATNRMNVAITGLEHWPRQTYFPSLLETLIMLGIAAVGFSAFYLIARYLPIFESEPEAQAPRDEVWAEEGA